MVKALMVQGTGSNVGKSMLVAGLARAFAQEGLRVRPFKPQNMSNNAAVTADGGEIGRAQALQARAARVAPSVHMNPVLLKPESETGAQLIVQGHRIGRAEAARYGADKPSLLPRVLESFAQLATEADLILVEGAGSPAETNLRAGDIANMGFATAADVPVLLIGDIDRGGVIAQIVGTQAVLSGRDNALIAGFAVNKFRGDVRLFEEGLRDTEARTGWPSLGVVPWFPQAHLLPAEDVLDLASAPADGAALIKIAVPHLPRIANFDDLDPLAAEPQVDLQIVPMGHPLPGDAALIILPGSKSTIADLQALRDQGWDIDIAAHLRRGGHLLGLCGGYQMLGRTVADPDGLEGPPQTVRGLGWLQIDTALTPRKQLALHSGRALPWDRPVAGYEIHMGRSEGPDAIKRPWLEIAGRPHGAATVDGRVRGAYLHGLFASDTFRAAFLHDLGARSALNYETTVDETLDALASHLRAHLDLAGVLALARAPRLGG